MHEPLVSIVIPAHNAENYIRETLQSVLCQTYTTLEVLVIDDGSTDTTTRVVDEISACDRRVRLLRQSNQGVAAARNTGIREAQGEFIAPIDADDLWSPDKIEKQVKCLVRAGSRAGLAYCWTVGIDEDGFMIYVSGRPREQGQVFSRHLRGNFIGNGSVPLIRRECFDRVGHYRTELRARGGEGCEDWDLSLRIAEHYEFCVVPEFLVAYRKVGGSMSWNHDAMQKSYELMIQDLRRRRTDLSLRDLRSSKSNFLLYLIRYRLKSHRFVSAVQGLGQAFVLHPGLVIQDVGLTAYGRLRRLLLAGFRIVPRKRRPFLHASRNVSQNTSDSQVALSAEV